MASVKWRALDDDERKPWNERAALDKQRYEREMETYQPPPGMTAQRSRKKVINFIIIIRPTLSVGLIQ